MIFKSGRKKKKMGNVASAEYFGSGLDLIHSLDKKWAMFENVVVVATEWIRIVMMNGSEMYE